ncbi:MAG: alpha/beta hydrolase [Fimbriimonadia bacterium]|nr:alpha/beta hydrolase [Fimbriimonadia bacterium]
MRAYDDSTSLGKLFVIDIKRVQHKGGGTPNLTTLNRFHHRFIPARADDLPTLLLLHGTGGNEEDLVPLGEMILPHAALISPRGQILENGMPRFFRRLAEGVFDVEDMIARVGELTEFLSEASAHYGFDPHAVIGVGFSNGANTAAGMLALHPDSLLSAALIRPMALPFIPDPMPNLQSKSVLILSGDYDPIIPRDHPERLTQFLESAGAQVEFHSLPAGHGLTAQDARILQEWLASR